MKKVLVFALFGAWLFANSQFYFLTTKGDYGTLNSTVAKTFSDAGYKLGENRDMVTPFKKQFNNSYFAFYNLLNVHNAKFVSKLTAIDPNFGAFSPFTVATYEKDGKFYAGVLKPTAMAEILGMKGGKKELESYEKEVIALLKKALPKATEHKVNYKTKNSKLPYLISYEYETDSDASSTKNDLEMQFENEIDVNGFVIANYNDLMSQIDNKDDFGFFSTYSICKLSVFYYVSKTRPEAGVFGPCTFAMYQQKGADHAVMVYPSVYNWIDRLGIDDQEAIDQLLRAEGQIIDGLKRITE